MRSQEFAERVERVLDVLITNYVKENGRHAQEDLVVLEKLREEAQRQQGEGGSDLLVGIADAAGPL